MPTQGTSNSARFAHSSGGGFCVVCGTVWPCAQASRQHDDLDAPPGN